MEDYTVYRLKFKTQLHLGRATGAAQTGSLGLEKTATYIPADTLFSALCQTWVTFYDTDSLKKFLEQYKEDSEALPFMLTSAFPYAQKVYLLPKPMTLRESQDTLEKAKAQKKIKKLQFVSAPLFRQAISGHLPEFIKDKPITINGEEICFINSENVWVSSEERDQLQNAMDDKLNVWETTTRPRVTIGAQNSGSEIWHVQTVQFNKNCGLWFAANFDSDETKQKVETLLRVLGDNGIGGERNAGYGQFEFCPADDIVIPTVEDSTHFVTLSPICPKSSDQLEHLLKGDIAYNLNPLTGWVGATGTHKKRKKVNMFAEGSVLNAYDKPIGRLVDLRPNGFTHPVYRYGYAWRIGINDTSKPVGAVS